MILTVDKDKEDIFTLINIFNKTRVDLDRGEKAYNNTNDKQKQQTYSPYIEKLQNYLQMMYAEFHHKYGIELTDEEYLMGINPYKYIKELKLKEVS